MPPRRPLRSGALAALALTMGVAACGTSPASPRPSAAGSGPPPAPSVEASAPPTASPEPCGPPILEARLPWWNERVFYEVFVRSFQDADGDGIGDLRGLIDRLDYLNDGDAATDDDLGVTGLWLMPVSEAASYHGYDVLDYRAIERDYGTADDFRALVAAAHERGIAVIVDLVMNHTSIEHPWFLEARSPGSPREDWYLFEDARPRGVAKPGGGRVWHELDGRFYYAYFWEGMPDLDLANEDVTAELDSIARYWLEDFGVDGFRLDAIKHLFEDGEELEDVPESKTWLAGFQDRLEEVDPDVLLVGEAWDVTSQSAAYVPEAVDLAFDFGLAESMLLGIDNRNPSPIRSALAEALALHPPGQFATFLANHDQPRVATRLASAEEARLAATTLLMLPGVPFLYYGEELGMTGTKPDERIRTPMPWNASPGGGFTTGEPWQPPAEGIEETNVASQSADPGSLLSTYRALIRLRDAHPALRGPDAVALESSARPVLALVRRAPGEIILVLANLAAEPVTGTAIDLASALPCGTSVARVEVLLGDAQVDPPVDPSSWVPVETLEPWQSVVVRLSP